MQRSRAAVLRDAQKQLGDLLDAVVNAAPVNSLTALVSAADADMASQPPGFSIDPLTGM
jgi:hypothetical protein